MKKAALLLVIITLFYHSLLAIDTPDQFLGFKLGSDRNLAHYSQISAYLQKLASQSERVRYQVLGQTTRKHEMVMAIISASENLKDVDRYLTIARKLAQAEVADSEAGPLADQGKAIVVVSCNLHADEIGSTQMAMELAYLLASSESPEVKDILQNVILMLIPSANPDGQIMEVEYYNRNKGSEYEGGSLPYLYHWYAGHDNNRDWFRLSLKETRLIMEQLYQKWFPQLQIDEHQMGSDGDRLFIPPFQDPPTPGVHPLVWREINLIGSRIAYDLENLHLRGVASRGFFTGWWIGALDDIAWFHNVPGILFEAASVNLATPVYVEPEEIAGGESQKNEERIFSPNPWKGGWWRLRDIIDYDLQATLAALRAASGLRRELLLNTFRIARDQIQLGQSEAPYAYIIPRDQPDVLTAEKLVRVLQLSGIRIFQLDHPIKVGEQLFNKKSFIVPLAQPYRAFVKNIFEPQHYPDLRRSIKEDPIAPYDMAGWTLPLGMGVKTFAVNEPFKAEMTPVQATELLRGQFPEKLDEYVLLSSEFNNSFKAAFALMQKGITVWRNSQAGEFPRGTFAARASEAAAALRDIQLQTPLVVATRPTVDLSGWKALRPLRAALYQNWAHNMSEGWLRFVFDEFSVPYDTLHPADVLKKDSLSTYDLLLFTGASETEIESGKPPKKWEKYFTPPPKEYSGGIGEKGLTVLKEFLKKGKTLVFMEESCDYAINKLKIPVTNVMDENSKVNCPGSYLRVELKESPLTAGMGPTAAIFFRNHPCFETVTPASAAQDRRTPVVFPGRDLLLSGWLEGEQLLARKSLVVDFRQGPGRIILIGPDLVHRTHSEGTYKLIFNTLLSAAEK